MGMKAFINSSVPKYFKNQEICAKSGSLKVLPENFENNFNN